MKLIFRALCLLYLLLPSSAKAIYNLQIEKALKKEYKEVIYLAHNDCYRVMSKSDKGYYGICDSEGNVMIPVTYQKFAFERSENGESIIFAMNPNYKAVSTGNLVYTKSRGIILDMGKNEPLYIPGGYISSHGKSVYNLKGEVALDCAQTSVQPIRDGKTIIGYKVSCRSYVNNQAVDELLICDSNFRTLFSLEGLGYLWKVELIRTPPKGYIWKCSQGTGADEYRTLFFNKDGSPVDNLSLDTFPSNNQKPSNAVTPSTGTSTRNLSKEYEVEKFEIDPLDLTARNVKTSRTDSNGRKCALLKVYVDDKIVEAQGNVIGEVRKNGMENWIYLSHDSKQVKLIFEKHFPLLIKFVDYNFPTVSEQMTYIIKLK